MKTPRNRSLILLPNLNRPARLPRSVFLYRLQSIGPDLLRQPWRSRWSRLNPTQGYCYLMSEILYHYVYPESEPYYVKIRGQTHWYLIRPVPQTNGQYLQTIDWTWQQYGNRWRPRYWDEGKRAAFFKGSIRTRRGYISRRAHELAKRLGVI